MLFFNACVKSIFGFNETTIHNMVLTITFNPTIDKSASITHLMPDKKLQCSDPLLEPGGGGINVARVIHRLGGEVSALFPAGGYNGQLLQNFLKSEGVDFIPVLISKSTRENLVILDRHTNLQYRFGMPGPQLAINEWQQILNIAERKNDIKFIVASGSLPPGVPMDIFARLAVIANERKVRLILDTSGEPLRLAIREGVYLIKPNLAELESVSDRGEIEIKDIQVVAREMIAQEYCEIVVVSLGASGAMLITESNVEMVHAPAVKKRSTVGAGDSMLGGIVYSLTKSDDIRKAIRLGVACGSAATLSPATGLCDPDAAYKLLDLINSNQVAQASNPQAST
jgi:6-phosphofructokinase 2